MYLMEKARCNVINVTAIVDVIACGGLPGVIFTCRYREQVDDEHAMHKAILTFHISIVFINISVRNGINM